MKQIKNQNTVIKKPATLDSVPGDIAEVMVDFVRSWTEIESDDAKREVERKIRDSSLRSISLASKLANRTFSIFLLQSITIELCHFTSLFYFTANNEQASKLVKFLRIDNSEAPNTFFSLPKGAEEAASLLPPIGMLPLNCTVSKAQAGAANITINEFLHRLGNLETFVNTFPELLSLQLVDMVSDKTFKPFPSMLLSVKRLEINSVHRYDEGILARNAVWILTFCPNLRQAILSLLITIEDSNFLSEYVETFQGLSRLQDLAIRLNYLFDETNRRTWWGSSSEAKQSWKKGNRKSDSLFHFLQVTNELQSLEIWSSRSVNREEDRTPIYDDCLDGLHNSFDTLKHLRLFGPRVRFPDASTPGLYRFKACRILSIEHWCLSGYFSSSQRQFPPGLETICIEYYDLPDTLEKLRSYLNEESYLLHFLSTGSFPELKQVAVPSRLIDCIYREPEEGDEIVGHLKRKWMKNRSALKEFKPIKEGVVKLRLLRAREIVGDPVKGESCLATHARHSPFATYRRSTEFEFKDGWRRSE